MKILRFHNLPGNLFERQRTFNTSQRLLSALRGIFLSSHPCSYNRFFLVWMQPLIVGPLLVQRTLVLYSGPLKIYAHGTFHYGERSPLPVRCECAGHRDTAVYCIVFFEILVAFPPGRDLPRPRCQGCGHDFVQTLTLCTFVNTMEAEMGKVAD